MTAVLLLAAAAYGGNGMGFGKQEIDVWASVYGTNDAATLNDVLVRLGTNEVAVGIDGGRWLIDDDVDVPSNVCLRVKRGSYFLFTNSATMRISGELVAGRQPLFVQAGGSTNTLVDGYGGSFLLVYPEWFQGGISHTNMVGAIDGPILELIQEMYDAMENLENGLPEPDSFYFECDTNMTAAAGWSATRTTWGESGIEPAMWSGGATSNGPVVIVKYPPFIVADDVMFPSFVTKEEFYAILNQMGFANYDSYTAETGSYASPWQAWTIPPNLTVGQVISVHLWGAGGGAAGGYARGDLVVVDPTNYATVGTNAWAVTNGQVLVVQVGTACQRSAVWRRDGPDFSTMSNELLVAGAAGAYGENRVSGGYGGGLAGLVGANVSIGGTWWGTQYGGLPGTQTNGGAGGMSTRGSSGRGTATTGADGERIFGGSGVTSDGGRGGDGYYGGGQGGWRSFYNDDPELYEGNAGGGGGSGYVAPGWSNATVVVTSGTNSVTNTLVAFTVPGSLTQPSLVSEVSYGLNAGYPGNPGRVAFEIKFDSWDRAIQQGE